MTSVWLLRFADLDGTWAKEEVEEVPTPSSTKKKYDQSPDADRVSLKCARQFWTNRPAMSRRWAYELPSLLISTDNANPHSVIDI